MSQVMTASGPEAMRVMAFTPSFRALSARVSLASLQPLEARCVIPDVMRAYGLGCGAARLSGRARENFAVMWWRPWCSRRPPTAADHGTPIKTKSDAYQVQRNSCPDRTQVADQACSGSDFKLNMHWSSSNHGPN
jgi:hypothetical protein